MSARKGQIMSTKISGRGKFLRPALVDEQDLYLFTEHNWSDSGVGYLATMERGSKRRMYLHRLIAGESERGHVVDHINGDTYDNRRCNLRIVTFAENLTAYRKKIVRSDTDNPVSKYVGVAWNRMAGLWVASTQKKYCGLFESEDDAARAADAERMANGIEPRYPHLGIISKGEAMARRSNRPRGPKQYRSAA